MGRLITTLGVRMPLRGSIATRRGGDRTMLAACRALRFRSILLGSSTLGKQTSGHAAAKPGSRQCGDHQVERNPVAKHVRHSNPRIATLHRGTIPGSFYQPLLSVGISGKSTRPFLAGLGGWPGWPRRLDRDATGRMLQGRGGSPTLAKTRRHLPEGAAPVASPRTGQRLTWCWAVDYYQAAEWLWAMAEVLFESGRTSWAWVRKMQKLLLKSEGVAFPGAAAGEAVG